MALEITPEPQPDERVAIEVALALAAEAAAEPGRGNWWRQGVLDAVGGEPEFPA